LLFSQIHGRGKELGGFASQQNKKKIKPKKPKKKTIMLNVGLAICEIFRFV
jgi:hypothetical protein